MTISPVKPPIVKKFKNFVSKQVTLAPPEGKLLTYKYIREFCKAQEKKLPKDSEMLVRAENIVRGTTLYSTYGKKWDTDEEQKTYLEGMAEESDKFKVYYNFTITVKTPT